MKPWYRRAENPIKRGFDISLGVFGLLLGAPVFFLIALLIKLEDGGPIFYIHPRIGKDGKAFPFFKFRTMKVDSDKSGFEIEAGDSRILRIGHFLRRWSVDEVPQLLNILRGEMSFIGPRPTLGYQVETYDSRQRGRLAVLPGVTGLAQVSGRNSLTWPERIELDLKYIENYSLWLDLWILMKTFGTVINPDGIYGHGWEKRPEGRYLVITSKTPALLGGAPTFQPPLAFTRPAVPEFSELAPEFEDILSSGNLTKGPRLARLEASLRDHLRSPHVVCVNSCTSGLILGIQALKLSGEVIVPSFSFMATFHALRWNNLTPVFVDCNPYSLTIDVEAVRAAITPRTCAVMSAYVFGNPPDLDAIDALCKEKGLAHFCDSAHGIGTLIDGVPAGNHADFEVFSCSPTKLLTAAEGGVVSTRRSDIDQWVRNGRDYGNPGSYDCDFAGLNARMSEFHAAIMQAGLPRLESYVQARARLVEVYQQHLKEVPGIRFQDIRAGVRSSNKDFPIFVEAAAFGLNRNQLQKALLAEGIPTRAYFDPPGHELTAYKQVLHLPVTERMCAEVLCLPMSSLMTDQEAERVSLCLSELQRQAPALASA